MSMCEYTYTHACSAYGDQKREALESQEFVSDPLWLLRAELLQEHKSL